MQKDPLGPLAEPVYVLKLALAQLENILEVAENALCEIERQAGERFPNLMTGPPINTTLQ